MIKGGCGGGRSSCPRHPGTHARLRVRFPLSPVHLHVAGSIFHVLGSVAGGIADCGAAVVGVCTGRGEEKEKERGIETSKPKTQASKRANERGQPMSANHEAKQE